MATKRIHFWSLAGQTVNTSTVNLVDPISVTIPSGGVAYARARAAGRDAAGGLAVAVEVSGCYKNVAGTVTLDGALSAVTVLGNALLLAATCALDVNSNAPRFTITGVATYTLDWMGVVEIDIYAP